MKKAIPTTEAAKAQDAQQNAQWRVDNCVWCPQRLGQHSRVIQEFLSTKENMQKGGDTK